MKFLSEQLNESAMSVKVVKDNDGARLYIKGAKDGCEISTDGVTFLPIEGKYIDLVIDYLKTHRK